MTVLPPFASVGNSTLIASSKCSITVVIISFNEEMHISRAIASVRPFASAVLVVDSFSNDKTVALAEAAGARVLTNKFISHSNQFQWALDHGSIETEWVMRLDSDEIIEPDLAAEITREVPQMAADIAGVNFARKHIFLGRWIKHGGRYPLILLRLWRVGQGRIEDRWMDEHIIVWGGRTMTMKGGFADHNLNDLTYFTDKHNKYATREALDVLIRKYRLSPLDRALTESSTSRQAYAKRWLKTKIYNKLPLWVGPFLYFLYRVVFRLGFLDGTSGMIYHVLQGFWYRYLVNAKLYELELAMADCEDTTMRIKRLTALTGYRLGVDA